MSGQEVQSPPSDTAASPSAGDDHNDGRSPMVMVLLSILSVLVLFGVLGGVAFGIMLIGVSGSQRPAFLVWSEPAEPGPNYVAGPKLTEFTLTERSGDEFDSRSLEGKVWVASFFYASCPHTCLRLNESVQKLEQDFGKQGVMFLSITCDPDRDTPEALKDYADRLGADDEQWLFLTGDMDYIKRIGQDMFSAGVNRVEHSDRVYIVDKKGDVRGRYDALDSIGFRSSQRLIKKLIDEPYEPQATAIGKSAEAKEGSGS